MARNNADPALETAGLILAAAEKGFLKKAVLSKPEDASRLRTVVTPRLIGGRKVLQAEIFTKDNKASHLNLPLGGDPATPGALENLIRGHRQVNLLTTAGDCEYRRSASGHDVLLGAAPLREKLTAIDGGEAVPDLPTPGNNREKQYVLKGDEPFLKALGVSDASGRIHDKKQPKFRQINRFLELIRDVEDRLPAEGTLRICDLCCGKSYLSFAVYHYFAVIRGRQVVMTGVDLKSDVIDYCNGVARSVGFDGLTFLAGDVGKYEAEGPVHMVISLHACDVATDLVLDRALHWGAEVILSTPCCHHELNHTLNCPTLSFIAEHSMLRQKFCDAATDALRLKRLEANGYEVAALELIDPEETPKNIMLRALKDRRFDPKGARARKATEEYEAAKRFLLGNAVVTEA